LKAIKMAVKIRTSTPSISVVKVYEGAAQKI
jgi:hypothetical protein